MCKLIRNILAILLLLFTFSVNGVILGYATGNHYIKRDNNAKLGWLIGAMDGIMAESLSIEKNKDGPWLGKCIEGISTAQIQAMFEKELKDNPDSWHAPAALIFRDKMKDFCKGRY